MYLSPQLRNVDLALASSELLFLYPLPLLSAELFTGLLCSGLTCYVRERKVFQSSFYLDNTAIMDI